MGMRIRDFDGHDYIETHSEYPFAGQLILLYVGK